LRAAAPHWSCYATGAYSIDGVHIGEHCIVVSLGIDHTGRKHALGLWDGSTKNAAVCSSLVFALVINNSASPNQWRTSRRMSPSR
jgi:hypothetical protein